MKTMKKVSALVLAATVALFLPALGADNKSGETSLQLAQCALKVSGMTCGGCAGAVQQALLKIEGVKQAEVDFNSGEAKVQFDPKKTTPEKIVTAFNESNPGFKVKQADKKGKTGNSDDKGSGERKSCCP